MDNLCCPAGEIVKSADGDYYCNICGRVWYFDNFDDIDDEEEVQ